MVVTVLKRGRWYNVSAGHYNPLILIAAQVSKLVGNMHSTSLSHIIFYYFMTINRISNKAKDKFVIKKCSETVSEEYQKNLQKAFLFPCFL